MSGGEWDYVTHKFGDVADRLLKEKSTLRRAFGEHMKLIALAMYAIEWVDSGDMDDGDEILPIETALGDSAAEKQMEILLNDARETIAELQKLGA